MNNEPERPDQRFVNDISSEKTNNRNLIRGHSKFVPSFEDILNEGMEQRKIATDINKNLLGFLNNYSKAKMLMLQNHNKRFKNIRNYPPELNFNLIPRIHRNSFNTHDYKSINQKNISVVNDLNLNLDIRS